MQPPKPHRRYDPNHPLISVHVPKTAGNSLRTVLRQWFGEKLFFHYADDATGALPEKQAWLPDSCIHGHFNRHRGFGPLDYYPQATQFIIFLRDPFATTVSLYFYLKQHGGKFPFGDRTVTVDEVAATLPEFIRLAGTHPGTIPGMSFLQYLPDEVDESNYRTLFADRFLHVGVTEQMQQSLNALADTLGKPRVTVTTENVSRYDEAVDPALRTLHENLFPLTHEIYRHALTASDL